MSEKRRKGKHALPLSGELPATLGRGSHLGTFKEFRNELDAAIRRRENRMRQGQALPPAEEETC